MKNYRLAIFSILLLSIPLLLPYPEASIKANPFHTPQEFQQFSAFHDSILPLGYNGLFAGSGECIECHGFDTAGIASVDILGNDINLVDDWRVSMMANSAKDPFWRAKVSHETTLYADKRDELETKCTACHAPIGHFAAIHAGETYYTMQDLLLDSLGQDGVSCLSCHQQSTESLGELHSGNLNFDTAKVAYGPYESPLASPMANANGYVPIYSEHIHDAGICAGCHTLINKTLDFDGNETGGTMVEQATYHEWLNSIYPAEDKSCQSCHLPEMAKGEVIIAAGFETVPRTPFYLHELAGANAFMLKLMRDNSEALELPASGADFDPIIAATENMLKNKSIQLDLSLINREMDTVFIAVDLKNLAGHKFPSGYPSRRAFVEVIAETTAGDTVFHSGYLDEDFDLPQQDMDYEPHYKTINSEDQVQIYELVMGDVNDEVTTVLARGSYAIKDNRLPPEGFTSMHATYDTVQIAGEAELDENFNKENAVEGTGKDQIFYHIPLNGNVEPLKISARVYYQTAPPRWMEEMFDLETPEINTFRTMFDQADRSPLMIKERSIDVEMYVVGTEDVSTPDWLSLSTNTSLQNPIFVRSEMSHDYRIFDLQGRLVFSATNQKGTYPLPSLQLTGAFIVVFEASNGLIQTEKIILF